MFNYRGISTRDSLWLSVGILLFLFIGISRAFKSSEVANFDKLNNVLVDLLPSDKLEENLEKASELLTNHLEKGNPLAEPVRLLLELNEVVQGDYKCSLKTFQIVMAADRATGSVAREENVELRRLDKFVRELSMKHASKCIRRYTREVSRIMRGMNPHHLTATEQYSWHLQEAVENHPRDSTPSWTQAFRDMFNKDYWKLENSGYVRAALSTIKLVSEMDPDSKYINRVADEKTGKLTVNKDKLQTLYEKYLVQPCRQLIKELGPTLEMIEQECKLRVQFGDTFEPGNCPERSARYQLKKCELLVNRDEKKLFKEMIKFVSRESV